MRSRYVLLMLLALLSTGAWAADAKDAKGADANAPVKDTKDVMIQHAWGYEPQPGQDKIALEMEVTCLPTFCKLTGIESKLAASGTMQRYWAKHGRLVVETISAVPLRHGHTMKFGVRSISLVLQGLRRPVTAGQRVPFTLTLILSGKNIEVDGYALVKPRPGAGSPASGAQAAQGSN